MVRSDSPNQFWLTCGWRVKGKTWLLCDGSGSKKSFQNTISTCTVIIIKYKFVDIKSVLTVINVLRKYTNVHLELFWNL